MDSLLMQSLLRANHFSMSTQYYTQQLYHMKVITLVSMNQVSPNTLPEDHISKKSHLKGINHNKIFYAFLNSGTLRIRL
jgi:hypothetical protein